MKFIGVYEDQIAVLKKENNRILVENLLTDVKLLDTIKQKTVISGLPTHAIARREVCLDLKRSKEILATLPFQIEPLTPFPIEETVVCPLLYKAPNGGTEVVVFLTSESKLKQHIESCSVDPDIVSTVASALARCIAFYNPALTHFFLLYEQTALVVAQNKIVFVQAYEEGEQPRVEAFIRSRWPGFTQVETVVDFGVAIGLALEGALAEQKVDFRGEKNPSLQTKQKQKKRMQLYLAAVAALTCLVWIVGLKMVTAQKEKIAALFHEESTVALDLQLKKWEASFEEKPRLFNHPAVLVTDLLAWISGKETPIEVVRLRYQLEGSQGVKVELEFTAPTPGVARDLHEALQRGEGPVDAKRTISWSFSGEKYVTSFFLRRTS